MTVFRTTHPEGFTETRNSKNGHYAYAVWVWTPADRYREWQTRLAATYYAPSRKARHLANAANCPESGNWRVVAWSGRLDLAEAAGRRLGRHYEIHPAEVVR